MPILPWALRALSFGGVPDLRSASSSSPLEVQISEGTVVGSVNSSYPNVRQFLGVPFAQPPVGSLRWLPPVSLSASNGTIDATTYGPSCPQIPLSFDAYFDPYAEAALDEGAVSEDCLSLSIWAPLESASEDLPVIIWIYGGNWIEGGTNIPYNIPLEWVERSQAHIVVGIQYRLGIFGYPGSAGLAEQNLGFLDQRAAIEWVSDNIAAFGGDASRIVLWGQSAGAASVDVQNFAYYEDPIAYGFIQDSGTAFYTITEGVSTLDEFPIVAAHFNCSNTVATLEVECMRSIPQTEISAYLATPNGTLLDFLPYYDNQIVFSNYTQRYLEGKISDGPAILGANLNEGTIFFGTTAEAATITLIFQCAVPYSTRLRTKLGLTTYTYEYRGNFTNVSPAPFLGAYHTSELPQIFGTAQIGGPDTSYEVEVSRTMQDLWLAFIQDPSTATSAGWLSTSLNETLIIAGNSTTGIGAVTEPLPESQVWPQCPPEYSYYLT